MPYKVQKKGVLLPRDKDRRVKYTEADKQQVRDLHASGMPQRAIARETGMSRRLVSFVLFPERHEVVKRQYSERRKDGRYYDKDTHREATKNHRRYKHKVLKNGN